MTTTAPQDGDQVPYPLYLRRVLTFTLFANILLFAGEMYFALHGLNPRDRYSTIFGRGSPGSPKGFGMSLNTHEALGCGAVIMLLTGIGFVIWRDRETMGGAIYSVFAFLTMGFTAMRLYVPLTQHRTISIGGHVDAMIWFTFCGMLAIEFIRRIHRFNEQQQIIGLRGLIASQ